jgi:hypothetical protein
VGRQDLPRGVKAREKEQGSIVIESHVENPSNWATKGGSIEE